jgi:hypothetical protein
MGAWRFTKWLNRPMRNHPEITLHFGTAEHSTSVPGQVETIMVTEKNGKNVGLIYEFPFTQANAIAKRLVKTYGAPAFVTPIEWQNTFGAIISGTQMIWKTPAGIMQFDDRSEQADKGRVVINPDEALDAKAWVQGLPPDKF